MIQRDSKLPTEHKVIHRVIHETQRLRARQAYCLNNQAMEDIGVYSVRELERRGLSPPHIRQLVEQGRLTKVCRGWYASRDANPRIVGYIRQGIRIGCLSGCKHHGLWVPPATQTHVIYHTGKKPPNGDGTFVHRYTFPRCDTAVWPVQDCLAQVLRAHGPEDSLIVIESALNLQLISPVDVQSLISGAPRRNRHLSASVSWAQSGSETRVRYFLQSRGVHVRTQVEILGVGRVDILAGELLIIECGSAAHHSGADSYENDRKRDMAAIGLGYEVFRLSYNQVWYEWEETKQALIQQIRRKRHRSGRR